MSPCNRNNVMIGSAARKVFSQGRFVTYALIGAVGGYVLMAWLFEARLVGIIIAAPIALVSKIGVLISLIDTIRTNTTSGEYGAFIVLALLLGVQFSLSLFVFKKTRTMHAAGVWGGIAGFIGGMLGVGCLACGTIALAPLFSLIGMGTAVGAGAVGGPVSLVVGIIILGISIVMTLRSIDRPLVCVPTHLPKTHKTE